MNNPGGTSERLLELVHEPVTEATRAELASLVAELPPAEQSTWRELRAEADLLQSRLAEVPPPNNLADLLAAPAEPIRPAKRGLSFRARVFVYAASTLIILGVVSWIYLNSEPAPPDLLPQATADKLAAAVIHLHESNPAMDVASADPSAVQAALKSYPMPFAPIMLTPRSKAELVGGGHTTLAGVPCLFTRWKAGSVVYTLCQFDGKPLSIPASFFVTHVAAKALWHDEFHYQVVFWPGPQGACTWALVLETEKTPDPFSSAY